MQLYLGASYNRLSVASDKKPFYLLVIIIFIKNIYPVIKFFLILTDLITS